MKTLFKTFGRKLLLMSKWELYLTKNTGDVVVGVFPNKKEAKEESKYRQDLIKVFDKEFEIGYNVRKVRS